MMMRRFSISFITLFLLAFCMSCGKSSKGGVKNEASGTEEEVLFKEENQQSEDESEHLAFWFPKIDSLNHGFVDVAEKIWLFGRGKDSIDIYDYKYQQPWQEECEKYLVNHFDNIYLFRDMPDEEKADSMLNEIESFFEENADFSNMGMLVYYDLRENFLIYRIATYTKAMLKINPAYSEEVEAWTDLHKAMNGFCDDIVDAQWFGGSGAIPAMLYSRNTICQCRVDDLKRVLQSKGKTKTGKVNRRKLLNAIDKAISSCSKPEEMEENLSDDQMVGYRNLTNRIPRKKEKLLESFENWMRHRKEMPGTSQFVDQMVKAIIACIAVG